MFSSWFPSPDSLKCSLRNCTFVFKVIHANAREDIQCQISTLTEFGGAKGKRIMKICEWNKHFFIYAVICYCYICVCVFMPLCTFNIRSQKISTSVKEYFPECVKGMYGGDCTSRCGQCANSQACDKSSGECAGGCQANYMEPLCKGKSLKST